jgi:mono/diheme cytochrome c family protein
MSAGRWIALLLAASLTAGCSLAGDITPPPDLATAQAAQPAIAPVVPEAGQAFAPPATPPDLASGAMLFAERCAPCHGPAGLGDGQQAAALSIPPTALGAPEVSQTATGAAWYDVVTRGRIERFMPPFVSLSDQQRWDVVAYALSLGMTQQSVQDGMAIYQAQCAACHGDNGQGGTVGPALTDPQQLAERSLAATVALIQQGRGQMPPFADALSENEQQAAAAFVRGLSFSAPTAAVPPTAQAQPAATSAGTPAEPALEAGTPSAIAATAEPALPVAAVIRGTVSNATPSGKVPSGLGVTLKGFDGDVEVVSEESQLDTSGAFAFEDVEMVPGRLYFVIVEHQGLSYASEVAHLLPAQASLDLPVAIHDATDSTQDLAIERLHALFDFSIDGTVRVIELWILTNQGEQTIAPADGIAVTLPDGATDLQFENGQVGQRFLLNETGFADMEPVAPGQGSGELVFSYNLPYERRLDFEQPVNYPVSAVVLLSPEPGPKLQAEGLQDMGEREISTGVIRTYGLGPVAAGDALRVNLSGRPAASSATGSLPPNLGLAIGLAAVGLALIAAGLLWFRPKREAPEPEESPPPTDPEREGLLRAIARLDDDFEAGRLPEAEYREQREALKRSLLATSAEGDGGVG